MPNKYSKQRHERYLENREEVLAKSKIYQQKNKERIAKKKHENYIKNREVILAKSKAFHLKHKERHNAKGRENKIKNTVPADVKCAMCDNPTRKYYTYIYKTCSQECESKLQSYLTKGKNNPRYTGGMPKCLDCDNRVTKKSNKSNPGGYTARCRPCSARFRRESWTKEELENKKYGQKLTGVFRRMIAGKQTGLRASRDALKYLGCSIKEVKLHLERQFTEGMTWENYGFRGWHIDHIIPLASFDFLDEAQRVKAFHYTNLQPLWWIDNLQKNAKLEWEGPHTHEWITKCGICGKSEAEHD